MMKMIIAILLLLVANMAGAGDVLVTVNAEPGTRWELRVNGVEHPPVPPGMPIHARDGDEIEIAVKPAGIVVERLDLPLTIRALRVLAGAEEEE